MTRAADLEIVNDQISQWGDGPRERMQRHWEGTGKSRGRKRRQVVPACSDPSFAGAEFAEGDQE